MQLFFSFILILIYSIAIYPVVIIIGALFTFGKPTNDENIITIATTLSVLFFLYQMWKAYKYSNEEVEEKL